MKRIKNKIHFLIKHRFRTASVLVVFDIILLFSFPHVDSLYNYIDLFIALSAILLLVGLSAHNLLKTGIGLLIVMTFMSLLGRNGTAEFLGNITYYILLLG